MATGRRCGGCVEVRESGRVLSQPTAAISYGSEALWIYTVLVLYGHGTLYPRRLQKRLKRRFSDSDSLKGVDTGRALGAEAPDFESYCCLCSRMVSTFRYRAGWISLADCLGRLLHYWSLTGRSLVKMDFRFQQYCCKPRYERHADDFRCS